MKNTLIALLFIFSFNLNAQFPDTLELELPWEVINMSSCDATMGEGPTTSKEGVVILLESDEIVTDEFNECEVRTKEWLIFDWFAGVGYNFTQVGNPSETIFTNCKNEIHLRLDDFPFELTPEDVLLAYNPSHDYSFSFSDPDDETIIGNSFPSISSNFDIYVYDFTDNSVCKSSVYITKCEEEISLDFPEVVEIEFNGEPYIQLTLEMLGVTIDYPCESYTTRMKIFNQYGGILGSNLVGESVVLEVEINFEDGSKYTNEIFLNVTGTKPEALKMFIEEKSFVAGETISLEVWSEDVPGLVTWGLQLEFIEAEILSIQSSELFNEIPHNIYDAGQEIKALWVPADGLSMDVESDATWFTLIVKPNIDGDTQDIFETELDPWSEIILEDENYIFEFPAEFTFITAPRNVLGVDSELNYSEIEVFPNPSSHDISISGLPNINSTSKIEILNMDGRLMWVKEFTTQGSTLNIDISDLPSGMFMLKLQNGKIFSSHKISKI